MAPFHVTMTPAVQRQLDGIRGAAPFALRGVILALAAEPRPPGAGRISGRSNLWRVRVRIDGQPWRIVYLVDAKAQTVVVTRVARRDEGTYRRL